VPTICALQRIVVSRSTPRPAAAGTAAHPPAASLAPAALQATLARYGIALPPERSRRNCRLIRAAERIGFPVALKICS
jgi:hypothetical protein